jgi:hypothetical protein
MTLARVTKFKKLSPALVIDADERGKVWYKKVVPNALLFTY